MTLTRAIGTRLTVFAVSLLGASLVIFAICSALPGDVAQVILGQGADPASVAALRERLGLDRPAAVRYVSWLTGMLTGDFGASYVSGTPVSRQIGARLGVTAGLVFWSVIVSVLVAVPLGMLAAVKRRHWQGFAASALAQVGLSIPAFWAGILLVLLFSVTLRWLPANGYTPFTSHPVRWLQRMMLPIAALGIMQASVLTRYVRSAIIEVTSEDYFRTARAVGWTQGRALLRHGLRNAALSVVTVLGLQISSLLVGSIVIESVFTLPGLGSLLLSSVAQRDLMVVQGIVMLLVFAVLLVNALVDLSYLLIDPRLRTTGERS